jgi:UDPglucose--hexose-1-phosphate uridylyltransferase
MMIKEKDFLTIQGQPVTLETKLGLLIEELLFFGVESSMMDSLDIPLVRNQLLSLMGIPEPFENDEVLQEEIGTVDFSTALPILEQLLDGAVLKGFIENNTTERDLFDARIMGCLMPRQSELYNTYRYLQVTQSKEAATDFFYQLSINSNYIRMDRIDKNVYWLADTDYGDLEITINLSKPEKDPQEIAKARLLPQASYPKCLLCLENVGYEGRLNHPGRANHRVLPITLNNEAWYFQYSPYVYYNEHSIIFKGKHEPMKVSRETFVRLLDFVEELPHYFLGSNADLPIVGGSILSHDHFQGGHHQFPMEVAPAFATAMDPMHPDVHISLVKWPLSVMRLASTNKEALVEMATYILDQWRGYSDTQVGIYAYSTHDKIPTELAIDASGSDNVPHNTITPISRVNKDGFYEIDLVLRNNRQSDEHPDGIFHPHAHLHHIKKENIGLIEVMGLAVLPARLKEELDVIEDLLTGLSMDALEASMDQHRPWIDELIAHYGTHNTKDAANQIVKTEVGHKFAEVLACAGVYKLDEAGIEGLKRFVVSMGYNVK